MANGRNSGLCPKCRRLISLDEPSCPYCGLPRPGASLHGAFLTWFSFQGMMPIKVILFTNIAFYLLCFFLNPSTSQGLFNIFAPSQGILFILGATGTLPIDNFGRWWTLVSASYLHGSILHIFFNMTALYQLGPFVVGEFGFWRFFAIYTFSGIGGFLLSYVAGVPFTIGASASICGLIGAIAYFGKSRGGFFGNAIYKQALGWIAGLAIFGLVVSGINNWAHGGGLVTGALAAFLLGYEDRGAEDRHHRFIGVGCLVVTAVILLWDLFQAVIRLLSHMG